MSVSIDLELLQVLETQAQKATAVNFALAAIENILSDTLNLDTLAATSPGDDIILPFDDANDLSSRLALRFIHLILDAGATAPFDVIHPDNKHFFFVKNETDQLATVKTLAGAGPVANAGEILLCYCNGTDVIEITTNYHPVEFLVRQDVTPATGKVLKLLVLAREVVIPANFEGSAGSLLTNPAATFDIDITNDGVSIGTASISTSGVYTFTTVGGLPITAAAGSRLSVVAPVATDASISGILINLISSGK